MTLKCIKHGAAFLFAIVVTSFIQVSYAQVVNIAQAGLIESGVGAVPNVSGATCAAVSGNYAYVVGTGNVLQILDITIPGLPQHKGSISNGEGGAVLQGARSIFISGNYAYIANTNGYSLEIVDVSDPAKPRHSAIVEHGAGPNAPHLVFPTSVFVMDNYAYVVSASVNGGLEIIDVSNPTNPIHVSKLVEGTPNAHLAVGLSIQVARVNNDVYAFIASAHSYNSLEIVKVTNPAQPQHVIAFQHSSISFPSSLWIAGKNVYVASVNTSAITKINISNPAAPVFKKVLTNPGGAGNTTGSLYRPWSVSTAGAYAYVASELGGIVIADTAELTIKKSMVDVSLGSFNNYSKSMVVQGNYAFVTVQSGKLSVLEDVADPLTTSPFIKTVVTTGAGGAIMGAPRFVYVHNGFAYVASDSDGSLEILDATDPTHPVHAAALAIGGPLAGPRSVYVAGGFAYVVTKNSLEIIDVNNPRAPVHRSSLKNGLAGATPYLSDPNSIQVATINQIKYAFIASTSSNALEIVNVNNPDAPAHAGALKTNVANNTFPYLASPTHLQVLGNFAYVISNSVYATGTGALEIINITDPTNPTHTGSLVGVGANTSLGANNIAVATRSADTFAYICTSVNSTNALEIVNVTTPSAPVKVSTTNTFDPDLNLRFPRGIGLYSNYAVIACFGGVRVFDVANPAAPIRHSTLYNLNQGALVDQPTSLFLSGRYVYVTNLGLTANLNVADLVAPKITGFSPTTGVAGSTVKIDGQNFNTFVTASINGVSVPITNVTANDITLTIPNDATVGKITLRHYNQHLRTSANFIVTPALANSTAIGQTAFSANWSNTNATSYFLDVSSDNFSTFITGYNTKNVGKVTTHQVTGLSPGTQYQVRVRSSDGVLVSSNSVVGNTQTIPATPVLNAASGATQSSFVISWTPAVLATGYKVDVSTTDTFSPFVGNYNDLAVTANSVTVNGLEAGTRYYFQVRSVNANGNSPSSLVQSAVTVPAIPIASSATSVNTTGFVANWSATAGATQYEIDISTDNFATFVSGKQSVPATTNFATIDGLAAGTSYQYRVRAVNPWGVSGSSNVTSVLTETPVPAAQPTNMLFSNVSGNALTLSFTKATGEPSGYLVLRSAEADNSVLPAEGIAYASGATLGNSSVAYVGSSVSFFDGGLPSATRYFYNIYAYNGSGASINYLTTTPLKGNVLLDVEPPMLSTPPIPNPATITAGNTPVFNITITDNTKVASAQIFYRGIGRSSFSNAPLALSGTGSNYSAQIQTTWYDSLGLEYYFVAKDENGNTSVKPSSSFSRVVNPSFALPPLPSGTDQSSYRIVSFPFQLSTDNNVATVYGNVPWNDKTKSGLWWWNPSLKSGAGDYDRYGESATLRTIDPGKGYWIITSSPVSPQLSNVPAPNVSRTKLFQMILKPGWNQIGNPYPVAISWDDVIAYNQQSGSSGSFGKLNLFDGKSLKEATGAVKLKPFEGGFVKNLTSSDIIIQIPFPGQSPSGGRAKEFSQDISSTAWRIAMHIQQDGLINTLGGFGMHPSAIAEEDQFDNFSPPKFLAIPELHFSKSHNPTLLFASDIVTTTEDHVWRFVPEGEQGKKTELTWDPVMEGDPDLQIFLFDQESLTLTDMRTIGSYSFILSRNSSFKILFGRDLQNKLMTDEIVALTPFPNPLQADQTINYKISLPDTDTKFSVRFQLISLQGNVVYSSSATLPPGVHTVNVSPRATLPSGVLLYRISATSAKTTKTYSGKIVNP